MGCNEPGILYLYDIFDQSELNYDSAEDAYSNNNSNITNYENNTFDETHYVYTFTSDYVEIYFNQCFDDSFIPEEASIIIISVGFCGVIHCACIYFVLSRPDDIELKIRIR